MSRNAEALTKDAAVKGTMLLAHIAWARERLGAEPGPRIRAALGPEAAKLVDRGVLATDWIPFSSLIEVDRALASEVGGHADEAYEEMGYHSASQNLGGVYRQFVAEDPHRFFEQMALLHRRFQNFGHCEYERSTPRSGVIRVEDCEAFSPVYCASARGYYEGALVTMGISDSVRVVERRCRCGGDELCEFELAW